MPFYSDLAQSYAHSLNIVKGWPHPAALDFFAKASANVLYNLRPGQCCSLNSSGELEPGVALARMGLFLFQGVRSRDVDNRSSDTWVSGGIPSGNIMCIVAKSGVELETTEFVPGTYNPNDLLKSPTGNTANDEALDANGLPTSSSSGVLTKSSVTLYTTAVVGVVSRGTLTNYNKKSVLSFWPVYLPGTA